MKDVEILIGDCRNSLREMSSRGERAQMCVTSPPYFGLRDYGHAGQLGLEKTPDEYIAAMVEVFRCVRDVLSEDGTLWLNLGDSYGKGKQLLGIPWRMAFALQADGWVLRQEIIWAKSNPMPESVTDRCTKAHESLFLLAKRPNYYFDHEAIKEPLAESSVARLSQNVDQQKGSDRVPGKTNGPMKAVRSKRDSFKREGSKREQAIPGHSVGTHRPDRKESEYDLNTRNKRSVWTVATRPYKGAHFATFPPALVEPCVLSGSRIGDVILDPFGGSGTTAGVAIAHGRKAVLCELNPDYVSLMDERIKSIAGLNQDLFLGS